MFCVECDKNYYSEILKDNEDVNCLPATWSNYHCGSRIKEVMKCLKCKNILYLNLKNNKLICLNKTCNFCIIWQCYVCNKEFKSQAKIYNPLELEIVNKTINRAILYKNKAIPPLLPCCGGEINDKLIFYHKKECKGQLFKSYLNNKDIVICEKCHALNSYERFSWLCPLCGKYFRLNEKTKSHDYSNSSIWHTNHQKSLIIGKSNYNNLIDFKTTGDSNTSMYKTKNNSKSTDKNKNNNSSTNLNKRNTNSNNLEKFKKIIIINPKNTIFNIFFFISKNFFCFIIPFITIITIIIFYSYYATGSLFVKNKIVFKLMHT